MTVTADERRALADLFDELGPDQPTLSGDWTTRELVAHLVVREGRPDAAPGILLEAFAKYTAQVTAKVATEPFADLVQRFRSGPPLWSPMRLPFVGDQANLFEFFVHHEDVRRAQPDWQPRLDDGRRDDALWKSLHMTARLLFRKSPVGVTLRSAGRGDIVASKNRAGHGEGHVEGEGHGVFLVGLPGEIVLVGFGRPVERARLVVEGTPQDIAAFEESERGL